MKPFVFFILLFLFTASVTWGKTTTDSKFKSPQVRQALDLIDRPSRENFERARSLLSDILKKHPKAAEARLALAHLRIAEHSHAPQGGIVGLREALMHVDIALKINPHLEEAYRKKSLILFLLDRKEEGFSVLAAALKKWPASQALHEARLAYLLHLGRIKEAEKFSELRHSRTKNKRDLLIRLGGIWQQAGYTDQADACFEHSLQLGETPQAWAALGRSAMLKKDHDQAISCFQHALALDAEYLAIYNDLAYCFYQVGQPQEAIRWMETYTQAFPDDLTALGNLAGLYEGAREKVKARLTWIKVRSGTRDPQQARLAEERLVKLKGQN